MLSKFYWVIENEIAGMAMPTACRAYSFLNEGEAAAREETRREIEELKTLGIGSIVTLTEDPLPGSLYTEAGFRYLHIPVLDMTAPTPSQIQQFLEFVQESVAEGKPVVAHCLGGSGRTGTMIACYLVSKGYHPEEAIRRVRALRPGAIENRFQEEAIEEYAYNSSNFDLSDL